MLPLDQHIFEFRKQFFKLAGGSFRVYDTNQRLLLFSEQKAFKIREDIRVYSDEAKTNQMLAIRTQQILDISPTYDILEMPSGEKAGSLKRKGLRSILRDEWEIYDPNGLMIGKVEEDSTVLAILRRFLTNLIPQKYQFVVGGQVVGTFQQQFNPFLYRATMDLTSDTGRRLDRRLALAAGILLLAIEGRQD
jgi:uncharacterized protein YxjI